MTGRASEPSVTPRPAGHTMQDGRCCGRKPLFYKTDYRTRARRPHHFCTKCDAEYDAEGVQRRNWAWGEIDGVLYHVVVTAKAAALDMLAALHEAKRWFVDTYGIEEDEQPLDVVCAAVAKAEGREGGR